MVINFPLYWRVLSKSFFGSKGTYSTLHPRRIGFLLIFLVVWPIYQAITWFFLMLDEVLFPAYRSQPIEKPMFIIGNFRSGSTFLHRLLSRDIRTFTSMRTVDIFLMPSITQRKVFRFFSSLDIKVGSPLTKGLRGVDNRSLGKVQIHKISMFDPEEDENILFHTWSTFFVSFLFPFLEDLPPYERFDEQIPLSEQERIMAFYRSCIQRHLYANGGKFHFVSKSPAASGKIRSLLKTFPDARMIYLARDPMDMLPSTVSWLSYAWNMFSETGQKYIYQKWISELAQYWYSYPLMVIDEVVENCKVINYDDLITSPEKVIRAIYMEMGYHTSPGLKKTIKRAVAETNSYISEHKYDLEQMGIDRQQVLATFKPVYDRFLFKAFSDTKPENF